MKIRTFYSPLRNSNRYLSLLFSVNFQPFNFDVGISENCQISETETISILKRRSESRLGAEFYVRVFLAIKDKASYYEIVKNYRVKSGGIQLSDLDSLYSPKGNYISTNLSGKLVKRFTGYSANKNDTTDLDGNEEME